MNKKIFFFVGIVFILLTIALLYNFEATVKIRCDGARTTYPLEANTTTYEGSIKMLGAFGNKVFSENIHLYNLVKNFGNGSWASADESTFSSESCVYQRMNDWSFR